MAFDVYLHKQAKKKFDRLKDLELKSRLKEAFGLLSEPFNLDTVKIHGEKAPSGRGSASTGSFSSSLEKPFISWTLTLAVKFISEG